MVATYRTGTARGPQGGGTMADYLLHETLAPERGSIAAYYLGEVPPVEQTLADRLGRELDEGAIGYDEAHGLLYAARVALEPQGRPIDHEAIFEVTGDDLVRAAERADFYEATAAAGGTVAELRRDLSPALATTFGITDRHRPLGRDEIANLLQAKQIDGSEILGRTKRSATLSVAEVFGLPTKGRDCAPPTGQALENVLAGRRADGRGPQNAKGEALLREVVAGASKRFMAIYGVSGEPDAQELANIRAGKLSGGGDLQGKDWRRKGNAVAERITFIDLTLSAPKSLSVAWALAPTPAEQAVMLSIHKDAVQQTMTYIANDVAVARRGDGGSKGEERGEVAYVTFSHYTARPALDVARVKDGEEYTERVEVPTQDPDMQLHSHAIIPNVVRSLESGHIGSIDGDRLKGKIHEYGAVYHAFVAQNARASGIAVKFDDTHGTSALSGVPQHIVEMFSKRSRDAHEAAIAYAAKLGKDFDTLPDEQKVALLKAGSDDMRQKKAERTNPTRSDFDGWREQASAAGYQHPSLLRRQAVAPEMPEHERRLEAAERALPRIDKMLQQRSVIEGQDLRIEAARAMIHTGIGDPRADIAAITRLFREHGVKQNGEMTAITWTDAERVRGKARVRVTTERHVELERETIMLAQTAAADRSRALSAAQIDRAAEAFIQKHPEIDQNGAQWQAQRQMMHGLAGQGALAVGVGVAGSGKSTVIAPLADAWRDDGRQVYAAALAWRQASDFASAGIPEGSRFSLATFLRRADKEKIALDRNSVVLVDELSLLGTRQLLHLEQLQAKHGFQLAMIGDPKQGQSIEAGRVYGLLEKALGEGAIPAITTSIRQRAAEDRATALLWRDGRAAEAIERKIAAVEFLLVAGGEQPVIERTADLWLERRQANRDDPDYSLHVETKTNAEARAVSLAIRDRQRVLGELGPDLKEVQAIDGNTGERYAMQLGNGDKVRLFDRVYDANTPGRTRLLANNGEVVTVTGIVDVGMVVRNDLTGAEGTIAWRKLQQERGGPVRAAYGTAATLATSQGATRTETIFSMPHGSTGIDGFSAYVADSRRIGHGYIVASEGAERRQITARRPIGTFDPIRQADVIRNIGENLSRQPQKTNAMELLGQAAAFHRGALRDLQMGSEPGERRRSRERDSHPLRYAHAYALHQLDLSPAIERVLEYARELSARLVRRQEQEIEGPRHERGRYLGLSR